MRAPAVVSRRTADLDRLREACLVAVVVLVPVVLGWVVWASPGGEGDANRRVTIAPFDTVLAVLVAVAIIGRVRERNDQPRSRATTKIAVALGTVLLVAFVVHPSPRGVDFALRIAAVVATGDALLRLGPPARHRVLGTTLAVAAAQSILAVAQSVHGGVVGLHNLEFEGFFYTFGSSTAGRGGFDHPYHLATFLVVALGAGLLGLRAASRRPLWLAGLAICGAGLAVTYSRAAVLGLVPVLVAAAVGAGPADRRRCSRAFAIAVAVGLIVGMLSFGSGWRARGESTSDGSRIDSARRERAAEALRLVRKEPLVGVGPGRYVIALESVHHERDLLPAHNIVLHAAAEAGIPAGVLSAALLIALGLSALRRGLETACAFGLLVPFLLLDAYPYIFPTGLAVTGIWLGLLGITSRERVAAHG